MLNKIALKATFKSVIKILLIFLIIGFLFSFLNSLSIQQKINQNYINTGRTAPNGPTATVILAKYISYILTLPFFIASVFPFYIKYLLYLIIIVIPIMILVFIYKKHCRSAIQK
jgi:hypothetical protein